MQSSKKVFVAGTFDNFHVGHQFFLWSALAFGNKITVVIARNETVEKLKGRRARNNEDVRKSRLEEEFVKVENVKIRLGNSNGDFLETLKKENPDILFLGFDQIFDEKKCLKFFPDLKIIRAKKYFPEVFKSSRFN